MKPLYVILIILTIIFGSMLRLWHLDQGFLSWDEGMYLNEAVFWHSIAANVPSLASDFVHKTLSFSDLLERIQGWPPSSGKPLHSFLMFLIMLVTGTSVANAKLTAALWGIATIILISILAFKWYGARAAVFSSLLLACSGYHIYVSRLATPETNSHVFLIFAWLLYMKSRDPEKGKRLWTIFWAGMCIGIMVAINYRWLIIAPLLWCVEGYDLLTQRSWHCVRRILVLTLGAGCVLLMCDVPYWPLYCMPDVKVAFSHMTEGVFSYFGQLQFFFKAQSSHGGYLIHGLYVRFLLAFNGVIATALACYGMIQLARRHRLKDLFIIIPIIVPFVLLSVKSRGNGIRYLSIALPFLALCAGVGYDHIMSYARGRILKSIGVAVLLAALSHGVYAAYPFITIESGYDKTRDFLIEHEGQQTLSTSNAYFEYYFGRNVTEQVPYWREEIIDVLKTGQYRYLMLDFMSHRVIHADVKKNIEQNCEPVKTIPNDIGNNYYTLIESLSFKHRRHNYIENALNDPFARVIALYDPQDVISVLEGGDENEK